MKPRGKDLALALTALLPAVPASAVQLGPDGLGQALFFPYYTSRTAEGGNALNTYLSIGNVTNDAKALRVRVREGRAAREVLGFNLYLSPNDVWTGAVVPTAQGARLVSIDASCTDPPFGTQLDLPLHANGYTGANADGFGDTLDRTREGFIEVLEMATLTGQSRANVIHTNAGVVPGCAAMRTDLSPSVAAPTGGLWGQLTLINVNNGQDFGIEAMALDRLASRPFFQHPGGAGPDFNAAEIDPVSVVVQGSQVYRATWTRPVDAVSAVLMRSSWMAEYVRDSATASQTDVVVTLPTRHHYVTGEAFTAPFRAAGRWAAGCGLTSSEGERLVVTFSNRESLTASVAPNLPAPLQYSPNLCAAAAVASIDDLLQAPPLSLERTHVLGSLTRGFGNGMIPLHSSGFENGWLRFFPEAPIGSMASGAQSTRTDLSTGTVTTGPQTYSGLPAIGFMVRTFRNGTLACTGGRACQGNYGGAFQFRHRTSITAP